ncbi:YkvA family protein [Salinimicrobium sp. GXAS 041]|uniref:YkvA family protein n=1 Tax=Salinimicrobium sp. GXAS 041 TaxID=3400806 RepID=UPI003C706BDD
MKNISQEQASKELHKEAENVEEKDLDRVLSKKEKIENKILNNETVEKYVEKGKMMFSLINDYRKGNYTEVPWKTIAAVAGALLYVLNPLDLIPDFIPVIGMLDDASVLAVCLKLVNDDLEKYTDWKLNSSSEEVGSPA